MTTPNIEELCESLRELVDLHTYAYEVANEAANALQSQAERIKELEGDVSHLQSTINTMCNAIPDYDWSGGAAALIAVGFAERDTLRAQIAEIAATEPYCFHWVDRWGCNHYADPKESIGPNAQPLFTRPMPADVNAEINHETMAPVRRFLADRAIYLSDETTKQLIETALSKYKGAK